MATMKQEFQSEEGQSMVEYTMLTGLITLGVVVMLTILGQQVQDTFTSFVTAIGWTPTP